LAELRFPSIRVQIARTRLAFIHLDNLLHFAKIDRDGRVDGFVVAYLPNQVTVLFLRTGELVTAASYTEVGRMVQPIATALDLMRQERERGELCYCDAPHEQLAWMYQSLAAPAVTRELDVRRPESIFPTLQQEKFDGILELISDGRVNYLRFENGAFRDGHFCDRADGTPVPRHIESLFAPHEDGTRPQLAAAVFPGGSELPSQAPPELVQTYRDLFWGIVNVAERESGTDATKHAIKFRDLLRNVHGPLDAIGRPRDRDPIAIVSTPEELTYALSDWALQFLEQVEIVAPGVAPAVLKEATKEQRFLLQRAGFYERMPWTVHW
jgi:hypothetical protein